MAIVAASFPALGSRNFRLFFVGQFVSLIGTWAQTSALSWLVYRLTGDAKLLGLVAAASQAPIFLLASFGGVVADRMDARRLAVITQVLQLFQAFLMAVLVFRGTVQFWHILALALVLGVTNAFDIPARQVLVARTVDREHLPNAIALNSSIFHGSRIVGPALGTFLIAAVGEGWCFVGNGLSFLAAIAGLLLMRLPAWDASQTHPPFMEHLVEGFRYVARDRPVRLLLLLLGAICLLAMPYTVLLPIFADQILHGGVKGYGLLMACSGTGALAGSLALAVRRNPEGLERTVVLGAAGVGGALVCFARSRQLWLSALLLLPVGVGMVTHMTANNTLVQLLIPDKMRGRVMAFHAMVFTFAMPVGCLVAGYAAHHLGAPLTASLGGLGCVLAALLFHARFPRNAPTRTP
jgi:MFS family permease